jgi:hypothetical protein
MTRLLAGCLLMSGCVMPGAVDGGTGPDASARACLEVSAPLVDFGEVEAFGFGFETVELTNTSPQFRVVQGLAIDSPFQLQGEAGPFTLAPMQGRTIGLGFAPSDALLHLRTLELNGGEGCVATVSLRGLGGGGVHLEPTRLDFGFVAPQTVKTLELRLVNTRRVEVPLIALQIQSQTQEPIFTADLPSNLVLPPMSSTPIPISARPPGDGAFAAGFSVISEGRSFGVLLQVVGGGPVAWLSPQRFDVPVVGFDPAVAGNQFSERVAVLRNVSTTGNAPEARLRLIGETRIESLDGGPTDELTIGFPFTLGNGLGPDQSSEITFSLTPQRLGPRSYRVTLVTNDPLQPEQVIALETNIETLGACSMRLEPPSLLALSPTDAGTSQGTVSFINEGARRCVVDDVRLSRETPATFRLIDTPPQFVVEPGQTHQVWLEGPRTLRGSVGSFGFHIFNPDSARQFISLQAPP